MTALTLALLMFVSSVGWSIDMHYCQGQLKTFNLLGEAKSCHQMALEVKSSHCKKKLMACHMKNGMDMHDEKDCCNNETVILDNLDNIYAYSSFHEMNKVDFIFFHSFFSAFFTAEEIPSVAVDYLNYRPPLPEKDISILFQTFLI